MARFRVVEKSFIGNRIVDAGAVVEVEFKDGGAPGPNLEALDAPAKKSKKGAAAADPATTDGARATEDLS
jgi:hypothetical protein